MDPVRNPYSPGAGSPPPALVGRDVELNQFDIAIQRLALGRSAKSLMLIGLRGVGKTVLLTEFARIAEGHRWVHQQLEATDDIQFASAMAMLVRKALLRLSAGQRMAARGRRAFGVLKSFQVRWQLPDGINLAIEFEPVPGRADSGVLDQDLADLFVELGEVARDRGVGVLFTIDEIQYVSHADLAALIVGLHRVSQQQLPLMVAGAGLPSLPALAGQAKSYAQRLFTFKTIDSLDRAEAEAALVAAAGVEGVTWSQAALTRVVSITEGYPYFLQEFGQESWNVAVGLDEIVKSDVDAAVPIAIDELDTGFFQTRIGRTTDAERAYLIAMASLGAGPHKSGEVATVMGKRTTQVGPNREALIKRGLCYSPRHGLIAFTVPMFDQFIRRHLR